MIEYYKKNHPFLAGEEVTRSEMGVVILLALMTSAGNLMVIVAVYKDPFRELRTISNYLVVNLATADLILGMIVEPIWALQRWVIASKTYSIAVNMLLILSVDASCITILVLTIERYIVLEMPLRRDTLFSVAATKIYIFLIWVTALVISSLLIPCWSEPAKNRSYNLFIFPGIGCPLLLIMLCLYIRMFMIIRNFNHAAFAGGDQQPLIQPREASLQARRRELEVAKAIFLFVGTFVLCWLPSIVTETIKYSSDTIQISEHVCRAVLFLGLLNSVLNPIVYTFRMPSFRRAIIEMFVCRSAGMLPTV